MKNKKIKYILSIFCISIFITGFLSQDILASNIPDIFVNYQTYNSDIEMNYGSLKENASDNNNYRTYLDTSVEVNEFNDYDDMVNFNNTVDYSNYIYSQEVYDFDDNSFNMTNGNYTATYNFDSEMNFYDNFNYTYSNNVVYSIENYQHNHLKVLEMYDNNNSVNMEITNRFSELRNYGTIEMWFYSDNVYQESFISLKNNDIESIRLRIYNNYLQYYDSGYNNIIELNNDTWYRLAIDFECSERGYFGLEKYQYDLRLNDIQYGSYDFFDNEGSLNLLNISTGINSYDYSFYLDSLGYNWNQIVYDSGNYTGSYSFDDEIGYNDYNNDISIIDDNNEYFSISVIESLYGHYSVLKLQDDSIYSTMKFFHNLNCSQEGIIEFWTYQTMSYNIIKLFNETSQEIESIQLNSYIDDNHWYHIKLVYDCLDEHYLLYIDGNLEINDYFTYNSTCLQKIQFGTMDDNNIVGNVYYDAFGFISNFYHNYTGSYSFDDEIGLQDDSISFVDSYIKESGCNIEVIESYNGHSSVLEIDSSPSSYQAYIRHNLDNKLNNVNFSIEFWSLQTNSRNRIGWYDSNSVCGKYLELSFYSDNNIWNHYKLDIDCLNANYSLYVNGILEVNSGSFTEYIGNVDFLLIGGLYSDTSTIIYYDAIGFYYYNNTGYFNATYDFNDELGLTDDSISFIDDINNGMNAEIVEGKKGHKNILFLDVDSVGTYYFQHFNDIAGISMTYEFWIYLEQQTALINIFADNGVCYSMRFYDSNIRVYTESTYNVHNYDVLNNWIHVRIDLMCLTDTFNLFIDDILYENNTKNINDLDANYITKILYYSYTSSAIFSLDAIGIYYNHTGNYNASYNCDTLDDFSYSSNVKLVDYYKNHLSNIYLNGSQEYIDLELDNKEFGTLEYWILGIDVSDLTFLHLREQNSLSYTGVNVHINDDYLRYYDGTSYDIVELNDDIWYHIRIDFECGSNNYLGLSADTYYIWLNGVRYGSYDFWYDIDYVAYYHFETHPSDLVETYIDALGFSWYDNYSIGQNLNDTYQYNKYEIGTDYNEYLQEYSNTYEIGSNQVAYLVYTTIDYSEFDNLFPNDYVLYLYVISQNLYSEYMIISKQSISLINEFKKRISSILNYDDGFCYYDGYWLFQYLGTIKRYDDNFNYVDSYTILIGSEIYWIDDLIAYNGLLYVSLGYYDKMRVYNSSFDYQYTINFEGSNYYDNFAIYDDIIYKMRYDSHLITYYINGSLINDYGLIHSVGCYDIFVSNLKVYIVDYNREIIVFDLTIVELYDIDLSSISGLRDLCIINDYVYMRIEKDYSVYIYLGFLTTSYLNKGTIKTYYLYDSSSNLKGKMVIESNNMYSFESYIFMLIFMKLYTFDGSFTEVVNFNQLIMINVSSDSRLEFDTHVQVGNRDFFKKLLINLTIINGNKNQSIIKEYSYNSEYKFDKMLMSMIYSQDNKGVYFNEYIKNTNVNYFSNDFYGFRIIACLDLSQKFTQFYDFGTFYNIILINEIPDVPDVPEIPEPQGLVWYVFGFTIVQSNEVIISSAHFNNTFIQISLSSIQIPFPVYQTSYSYGNWYDVIWNAIVWFTNILIIIGAGILYALFTAFEYTIVILFFTIVVLLWNLAFGGLIWIYLQILEGLFYFLPWFVDYISTTLIPIILDGIAWFIGFIGGYLLWLLSGGQLDLLAIQNAINVLTDNIFTVFYDIGLIVLRNLVHIINFISIYITIYYLMYFKLFLAKSRGFVNAVAQITLVMSIWSYPVKLLGKISTTISDLVPKIFPI